MSIQTCSPTAEVTTSWQESQRRVAPDARYVPWRLVVARLAQFSNSAGPPTFESEARLFDVRDQPPLEIWLKSNSTYPL
jgi:hypothetical protein